METTRRCICDAISVCVQGVPSLAFNAIYDRLQHPAISISIYFLRSVPQFISRGAFNVITVTSQSISNGTAYIVSVRRLLIASEQDYILHWPPVCPQYEVSLRKQLVGKRTQGGRHFV